MTSLAELVTVWHRLVELRKRREKVELLAAFLSRCEPDDLGTAALWLSGQSSRHRLGIGPAAVQRSANTEPATDSRLSIAAVSGQLEQLAEITGRGAQANRDQLLGQLFASATPEEQRFLTRLLLGELRQGALTGLLTEALSRATEIPLPLLRRALMLNGHIDEVAVIAAHNGLPGIRAVRLRPMQPLAPMLAETAEDLDTALGRIERPILEDKLDGVRVQIHKEGDRVRVFSRAGNELTDAMPDIVARVQVLPAFDLVVDGEALLLGADRRPLPFQTTMQRFARQRDPQRTPAHQPLHCFLFDCLHANGETLIDDATRLRQLALSDLVPAEMVIRRAAPAKRAEARSFLAQALADGHEGVMAKHPDAPYAAGNRGGHWLKIKHSHQVDLVVLAAEWGSGRRQGWLSNLHLGAADGHGGFIMLGKTFKGLTDAMLTWQTEQLLARETGRDGALLSVRPELVVEVAFNELQRSRHYPGGLALRFARVRRYRQDKTAAEATTFAELESLFRAQIAYRDLNS